MWKKPGFDVKTYLHLDSRKLFFGRSIHREVFNNAIQILLHQSNIHGKVNTKNSEIQENPKMSSRKLMKFLIMFDNSNLLFFPGQFLTGRVILEVDDDMPVLGKFSFWFKDNQHFISTSYRPQYLHLKSKSTKLKILTVNSISDVCPNRVVNQCH